MSLAGAQSSGSSVLGRDDVAERILTAVREGRPFSFVRLGDGEGLLLAFDSLARLEDYAYLGRHLGDQAKLHHIQRVRAELIDTILDADLVGIRDDVLNAGPDTVLIDPDAEDFADQMRARFPLRAVERDTKDIHGFRRIHMLWRWYRGFTFGRQQEICSQWVHADLQLADFWEDLIASQDNIALVHAHASVAERIQRRFGVTVDWIDIPDGGSSAPPDWRGASLAKQHMSRSGQVAGRVASIEPRTVVLVGAGLVGKRYCRDAKSAGGIALDIGALMDAWDGRATRQLVFQDKAPLTASKFGPPPEFTLRFPNRSACHDKQLILHVGLSKTGTTSIQRFLRDNSAALEDAGICYLSSGRVGRHQDAHHDIVHTIGHGELRLPDPAGAAKGTAFESLIATMDREISESRCEKFIVSSEFFTRCRLESQNCDMFFKWIQRYNTFILIYLRNQFDWLVSFYREASKNGNMHLFLDEFLRDRSNLWANERFDTNFLRRIAFFERVVSPGSIRIKNYDEICDSDLLLQDFVDYIGANREKFSYIERQNTSNGVSSDLVMAKKIALNRFLWRSEKIMQKDSIIIGEVSNYMKDRVFLTNEFEPVRERLREELRCEHSELNEEISRRYGINLKI